MNCMVIIHLRMKPSWWLTVLVGVIVIANSSMQNHSIVILWRPRVLPYLYPQKSRCFFAPSDRKETESWLQEIVTSSTNQSLNSPFWSCPSSIINNLPTSLANNLYVRWVPVSWSFSQGLSKRRRDVLPVVPGKENVVSIRLFSL